MANQSHASFAQTCKMNARNILQTFSGMDNIVNQNAAVGNDFFTNMTQDDLKLMNPNTSLTPTQFQAFMTYYQLLSQIRSATDAATFSSLLSQLTVLAGTLYTQTPPVTLDSFIIAMAGA